ncbi:O-methyltransferase [Deinococcus radiopugnans]|uniref:O-methyltransferase n=1 Tax=Deinococcus radiopugnans ATCC 19172 TaxID=585398 RepID=A0A5C4Y491_9DEIO|nr:O-methyltransferase [Deinococcus radiopugnans]MBB6017097.1 putative O-methyltransferase YrrM [Deinococcus radiopugnans ATCC 19172]TNM70672.1 O-methyltransferase [Deinococcus radiopugnans ATCC 19172]
MHNPPDPQDRWTAVDAYLSDLLIVQDAALAAALIDQAAAGLPAQNVSALQGQLLTLLAQMQGARRILEIGTLGGYSTLWLARALPPGGQLVTLELQPQRAALARRSLERAGLSGRVEVRVGQATDSLAQLSADGAAPFDFIFIDADKPSYTEYLTGALRLARPGTVLMVDNVVRGGCVISPESDDANVQGVRRFMAALAAEPRLTATALQTVGSKGYDGFVVARVNMAGDTILE